MPESASHYPISQFINSILDEYGFSRVEFVRALGYRNLERGLRRLDPWLDQGDGYDRIIKQIAAVYGRADQLETAIAETKKIKAAEYAAACLERCKAEAAHFHPFLYADGERTVPNQICIFGMTGGHRWTTVEIPSAILALPLEEQLPALPELMAAYRQKYNGAVPFFGKLTGFKFVRLLDYFQFDAEGRLIAHVEKPFRRGGVEISLR